ncbi:lipid IV(A) 3-deoxy-D-manno-octulosonic acid transferase [Vibrio paucivorans]|uniref:3-deoxy-D-manno-octulosonic acid transferase n=1 Tax=Vibrio paucivorans TaxID=2829489 RepID=A0A9X3CD81_9VIBR|nr:lipid IV(A) 3-deoxy-D-manno-octulosonic acid transferase [Vibrio paucivorans]MCW8333606.1 lipid IV(A) 3-deoxy-D-manno-octulosonic acid transferase [Vibrio paucivorans]
MTTFIRWCYTVILAIVSPLLLIGLYRSRPNKPKFGKRWKEHFGFAPPLQEKSKGVIWVHAVSVGEVLAAKKFVTSLQDRYPDKQVLVTTTTSTGAEQVTTFEGSVLHRYMPIDFSWCVKRFLKAMNPEALFIIETEIWPNTINSVAQTGIPIVLVNGRLSEKSAHNYQKLSLLISPTLSLFSRILTVHSDDKNRFESLGVAPNKVEVTGSIKYDVNVDDSIVMQGKELKQELGEDRKVLIAASTHQGEDELILSAYQRIKVKVPESLLILVPRHPERFDAVERLAQESGFSVVRRTSLDSDTSTDMDVYLGDTLGELMVMLAASDIVFMGGSLLGSKVGGHNFIEPALLKKYCLTGPSYYNFSDLAKQLIDAKALEIVNTPKEIAECVVTLIHNEHSLLEKGQAGYDYVLKNKGALEKTLGISEQVLAG